MNACSLRARDRQAIAAMLVIFGSPSLEQIQARMGEGLWQGSELDEQLVSIRAMFRADPVSPIRRAGQEELSAWIGWLDRRTARRVRLLLGDHLPQAHRRRRAGERLSDVELDSLQATLFTPLADGLDHGLRAGLHRLARSLPDASRAQVEMLLRGLPRSWLRCVHVARSRLSSAAPSASRVAQARAWWLRLSGGGEP